MRICVDISQVAHHGTGVARYTTNLIESICQYDTENNYTFFFSSLRKTVPSDIEALIKKKHRLVSIMLPPTLMDLLWNRAHVVPIEAFVGPQDLVISSDWTQPPTKAKKITVVHDLIAYRYPDELHPKTEFKSATLTISPNIVETQKIRLNWVKKESDVVLADSLSTKDDLIKFLGIEKDRIRVVYPAINVITPSQKEKETVLSRYNLKASRYILSVGKVEPRKNISRLIEAFSKTKINDVSLVIVGPEGWDNKMLETKGRIANISFLGFVPDLDLYALYSQALFFVYPSLYEGFGYPVVEAMSLGCPVAVSNASALAEVAGNSALLFEPTNTDQIKNTLQQLYSNETLRRQLVPKGYQRAGQLTKKHFFNTFLNSITQ